MKELLKFFLAGISDHIDLNLLIRLSGQGLVLPFYHAVSDRDLKHLKHLYPVLTTKRFEADLDFFQKNYKAVSWQHLKNCVEDKKLRKNNCFFLTFDDGLREFHDVVAPILIERSIPACCFINAAFVDNKDMFYRLKTSLLIDRIKEKKPTKGESEKMKQVFENKNFDYKEADDLHKISDQNQSILDQIADILEISFSEYLSYHKPYLTTDKIKNLVDQGFIIGAHSVSHPYYPLLTEEMQLEQTRQSVQFVKEKFKVSEKLFSFPYTDYNIKKSFFKSISRDVDLTFGTANLKLDVIETNFQRIPMEVPGKKDAEAIVKPEYFFYIMKRMLNKHVIQRL